MNKNHNDITILIVDDTVEDLKILNNMLVQLSYRVLQAPGVNIALSILDKTTPDIIILDIKMPDMSGFELCGLLKEREELLETPIIFISVLNETEDKIKALQCGGADYITKPFHFDEIKIRLKNQQAHILYRREVKKKNLVSELALTKLKKEVNEKKQAEEALKKSEERYRTLVDTTHTIPWEFDLSTWRFTFVGTHAINLLGYPLEEWYKERFWQDHLHPEDRDSTIKYCEAQTKLLLNHHLEYRMIAADDSIVWIYDLVTVVRNDTTPVQLRGIMVDITEQKRVEDKICTLSHAVDQSPSIVVITDIQGRIEYVNPRFTQVTEYSQSEVNGQNPRLLKSGKIPPEVYTDLWNTIQSGKMWQGELCNRNKSGKLYWEAASISSIKDQNGSITHFLAIKEVITERKNAESRLKAQHIVTQALADSETIKEAAPKILQSVCQALEWDIGEIFLLDKQLSVMRCLELWHTPSIKLPDFIEKTRQVTFPPGIGLPGRILSSTKPAWISDITMDPNFLRGELAAQEGLHGAFGFPILNGNEVLGTISFFSREYKSPDNDLLEMMAAIGSQIGVFIMRKNAESELKETEERYRKLIESAEDAIVCFDERETISIWNHSAENVFGYSESEAVGQSISNIIPEQLRQDNSMGMWEFLQSGKSGFYGKAIELTGKTKDRTSIPIEMSLSSHKFENGQHLHTVIIRDISERKMIEAELLKVQKLESLGILAGGIAHDFNNYLVGILGNITLAKMEADKSEHIYERLTTIEKATLLSRKLTNQLITFSKGGTPIKKMVAITAVIEDAISLSLRGTNVTCCPTIPNDIWPVEIDAEQITQVINNLIINADQAMPNGGAIHIRVENVTIKKQVVPLLKSGTYIKIMVEDEGIGIAEKDINNIFDPFFTTKRKGSGLGLTTCYSIIKNHGGTIRVETEKNIGTHFTIYLPASRVTYHENNAKSNGLATCTGRILFMDDEELIREVTESILTNIGYKVELAREGAEAIKLYKEFKKKGYPFDLVMLDLTVRGGLGGTSTIKELLRIDPKAKVIVSSGYSKDPVMSKFREYGFSGVIAKPYNMEELRKTLHDVRNRVEY
ncbi:MAG: PAS domain S-box protein [Planctomycetes bacterium]|nr:PAS domain S-box protein [Planctomycetota bacterium]